MTRDIYVENGVGRAVMNGINLFTQKHGFTACFQHDLHPGMQRPQKGDEWWIRDVATRNMAILTQDCAILGNDGERAAMVDAGARVIALGKAEYSRWDKMRCIAIHWGRIEEIIAREGACAVTLWLSRYEVDDFQD